MRSVQSGESNPLHSRIVGLSLAAHGQYTDTAAVAVLKEKIEECI